AAVVIDDAEARGDRTGVHAEDAHRVSMNEEFRISNSELRTPAAAGCAARDSPGLRLPRSATVLVHMQTIPDAPAGVREILERLVEAAGQAFGEDLVSVV